MIGFIIFGVCVLTTVLHFVVVAHIKKLTLSSESLFDYQYCFGGPLVILPVIGQIILFLTIYWYVKMLN